MKELVGIGFIATIVLLLVTAFEIWGIRNTLSEIKKRLPQNPPTKN